MREADAVVAGVCNVKALKDPSTDLGPASVRFIEPGIGLLAVENAWISVVQDSDPVLELRLGAD